MYRCIVALVLILRGSTAVAVDTEFFEARIRPVLIEHCYACHNSTHVAEGELALDSREAMQKGGASGQVIVPGKPEQSRLIAILKHEVDGLEMPQDGGKLDAKVIADFEKWISLGATDPRDHPPSPTEIEQATSWRSIIERRRQWWSFQPIKRPELTGGAEHPIDQLVGVKLKEVELSPAKPAEPVVLIRRLFFQLIGLPPTATELNYWLQRYATSTNDPGLTTEALVDHLLASKQFGPRWARHWMDWIRYAESHGSEGDPIINNAWMYRDYLIRALNDDIPYDQLVREHLAGDLIDNPRINHELELNESILGTIQLRMVFHGFSPTDALDEKVRFVDDQVNTISKAFLGITVSCARCHDHKFDAISQADYYAMFGIFAACRPARQVADSPAVQRQHQQALNELKLKIRSRLATHWIESLPTTAKRIAEKLTSQTPDDSLLSTIKNWPQWNSSLQNRQEPKEPKFIRRWQLGDANDLAAWHCSGECDKPNAPGGFAVALSGDSAVEGVYPGGVYSHLLSTKHPLRLSSPDVTLDGKYDFWIRALGAEGAATRYVTQDYPRTGTVFKDLKLTPNWAWRKLNLSYWEGDSVHFEIATGPDIPLQSSDKPRSWLGATEVRVVPQDSPAPADPANILAAILLENVSLPNSADEAQSLAISAIEQALQAWQQGTCTDLQSLLIDECIRFDLLDNQLDGLPQVRPLVEQYRTLESEIRVPQRVPGLDDVPARQQPLFVRGNHRQPADIVPRRFLEAIDSAPYPATVTGRRELAEDLLRDDNPLSRRVIVNRLWHHLFGRGLVATPDNFGKLGSLPTHPELLDWLAIRFVEDGWSLKKMIRLMVTSQTWQQSSVASNKSREIDPDNLYLSHANVRRLEAEAIRDAMLTAASMVDWNVQGQPVGSDSNRRSVFIRVHRNALDPMLRVFDFPEPHSSVGSRDVTNVPAQSLLVMNSPQVAAIATELADKLLLTSAELSDDERITNLFRRILSRDPTNTEREQLLQYLQSTTKTIQQRRSELDKLTASLATANHRIAEVIERQRKKMSEVELPAAAAKAMVTPIASWEFDQDGSDTLGNLHGLLIDGAKIVDGALALSQGAHLNTAPLVKSLTTKTLEAWVRLDNLEQRGGGVMTVQTQDGSVFDSIVFAEKEPGRWLAGSNNFARTMDFSGGTVEAEADDRFVQVAICYHADGTVIGYRDGVRYGNAYKTTPPVKFRAGKAIVSFGVRHLPNTGNRQLAGRIQRAKLYDKALSDDEVLEAFRQTSALISESRVLESLAEEQRVEVEELKRIVGDLAQSIDSYGPLPEGSDERQAWTDAARALLMLKEFIYVR